MFRNINDVFTFGFAKRRSPWSSITYNWILEKYHNAELVFDPSYPVLDEGIIERQDWASREFGQSLKEETPSNPPEPRGLGFVITVYVDADHAADTTTRKSKTGFIVNLNSAPIYSMCKKQASIESSSFGSEFTAMKQCT